MASPLKITNPDSIDAVKGQTLLDHLDFNVQVDNAVTFKVNRGRCGSLTSTGTWQTGCVGFQVPLFFFDRSGELDATPLPPGNPVTDFGAFSPVTPNGLGTKAFVGTGGYEFESSEYDATQTYNPNTPLKAPHNDTTIAVGGVLTPGIAGTDTLVGAVSRGQVPYINGVTRLAFWSFFLPVV